MSGSSETPAEIRADRDQAVDSSPSVFDVSALKFNADGLIPAVVQDVDSLQVLMLGWMDAEAIRRSATTGRATYWSRSRQEYWRKGDTSGHIQEVVAMNYDCDADTILLTVAQTGAACHTGSRSCFDDRSIPVATPSRQANTAAAETSRAYVTEAGEK
ncbi:phosphoribosyl-AMP cyclohydrolase [Pseudoglutamicibacter albus]|uniref:phosphoribosyl-AMP cyclohydrolase n=1 Tax=Pseudoglutamicibacter albus TaxID=98671 RepID=UPI000B1D0767